MYSFPNFEPVHCFISSSNCCFLTCIQISQEAGQVVQYFHLLKNFPQFIVIHTVKGFSIVNKAEVDVFLELSCFFNDPVNVGNLISGSCAFSKTSLSTDISMSHQVCSHCFILALLCTFTFKVKTPSRCRACGTLTPLIYISSQPHFCVLLKASGTAHHSFCPGTGQLPPSTL